MTTQNVTYCRATFTNMGVAGATTSYYFPRAVQSAGITQTSFTTTSAEAYVDQDGYDHLDVRGSITSGDPNNTVVVTVESDDGVTMTFVWDETRGMYDWMTGLWGTANFTATNATVRFRLFAVNANAKRWHVRIANTTAPAQAVNNSGIIEIRQIKV